MPYPYNGRLSPAVGGGLPGLPNRDLIASAAASSLFSPSGQTSSFPYLMPVGAPVLGAGGASIGMTPILTSNKVLTYDSTNTQYRVLSYGPTGLSGLVTTTATDASTAAAVCSFGQMLPISATRVVGVRSATQMSSVVINGAGLVTEVNNFATLSTSGTLVSGESFTNALWTLRSGSNPGYNVLTGRNGTIHVFGMAKVSGAICVLLWEYDVVGTLLGVYRMFTHPVANTDSFTFRSLDVYRRENFYHIVAFDVGPSAVFTANTSYVVVDISSPLMGTSVLVMGKNTGATTQSSSVKHVVRCAPRGMLVYYLNDNSNTVNQTMSFLAPIAANGAAMPVVVGTGGTTSSSLAGDGTFANYINSGAYNSYFNMWLSSAYPSSSAPSQSFGTFSSKLDVANPTGLSATRTRQVTKCVASPVSSANQMVFSIVNAAQAVDNQYQASIAASQGVNSLIPLENGYWLGAVSTDANTHGHQLYSEVTL